MCLSLAAASEVHGAVYDSPAFPSDDVIGVNDGLSSVVVRDPASSSGEALAEDGQGWTVTDGGMEPDLPAEAPGICPNDACTQDSCPPWNGVPGIINSHLGDAIPRLVFAADALMLWQGNVASRPLFINPATGLAAQDVNRINGPVSVGPRLDLILNLTRCHAIEANWFNVQTFSGSAAMLPGASQYAMNNLAGMSSGDVNYANVNQAAVFKSCELNWRRRTCTPVTWLAGFRWVEWDQTLGIVDNYTAAGPITGTDRMAVATGNNLYGGQVGADALLWNAGRWLAVNGVAKAGVFYNYQAFQRTDLLGDRSFGTFSADDSGTAFVGEVGVNGTVRVLRWLYWRAGYNFFWLSGVAVPAAQLSVTNQPAAPTTALNHSGSVFVHGVNTGLEARW